MISSEALHRILDNVCRKTARRAANRIPGYDLSKAERYLDTMRREGTSGWKHSEIIATIEARTAAGCQDPKDPSQLSALQDCFEDVVRQETDLRPA